ncbi:MAG: hypothetical protein QOE70_4442 [Chthoniobacter sp.]|jgi:hypothetical protein|nr:hypothetical protein [Chthoniobacter sp.]
MTPQSSFMVLATVTPAREAELRGLLDSMNDAPGRVNANNAVIPFSQLDTLHFARLLILEDKTIGDVSVHGLPTRTYPLYLAFLGDMDGDEDTFLDELARRASDGLRRLFSCCEGFTPDSDLLGWMQHHRRPAIATFVNWRGRTVRRVREEAALRAALDGYIASNASSLQGLAPRELHAKLSQFVEGEKSSGRLTLSAESPTPIGWWITNALYLVGAPLLLVLASPLLLLAPLYFLRLRYLEKTDAEVCPSVDQAYSEQLGLAEDHDVTNQFSALGSRKPGFVRLLTLTGVLSVVNYAARHVTRPGHLGRIRTIHFARWVFLDDKNRMVFFSNYDGSVEAYMDDFINKTGFGLNASFSSAIGYPRTRWLLFDGCADERKYKEYIRRHTIPTQVWYKAYPGLTVVDLEKNSRLRQGFEKSSMNDEEAREWVALL